MIASNSKLLLPPVTGAITPIASDNQGPGSLRVRCPAGTRRRGRACVGIPVSAVAREGRKPGTCTADELHYVDVPGTDWKLALWRYLPCPEGQRRNHPLLLLSGLGVNAVAYDLSPESSFARHMSSKGFDTWVLEIRGAGLSSVAMNSYAEDNGTSANLSKRLSYYLEEGNNSFIANQIKGFILELLTAMEDGQDSSEHQFFQEPLLTSIDDFLKELDLLIKSDWDFDHYLEEDLPAAMEYIRSQSKPKDGKLLAIGHSMGGMLLYAMLSRSCFDGRDSGLTSVTTLGSTLDYSSSRSLIKLLLPAADPAKALNMPAIPLGALTATAYPLISRPPYLLSWLSDYISSPGMLDPNLFEKLALSGVSTVPAKLLLQLATAFLDGGLQDRNGSFYYKEHLRKCAVPVLALAGDHDPICPPEAVHETVKVIPRHLVTYRVLGQPHGPHYAHYDLVGSRLAAHQVYPIIINFLSRHDM